MPRNHRHRTGTTPHAQPRVGPDQRRRVGPFHSATAMVAVFQIEPSRLRDLSPPPARRPRRRHQPPVTQRVNRRHQPRIRRRDAACRRTDTAQQLQLPLIQRIPSPHTTSTHQPQPKRDHLPCYPTRLSRWIALQRRIRRVVCDSAAHCATPRRTGPRRGRPPSSRRVGAEMSPKPMTCSVHRYRRRQAHGTCGLNQQRTPHRMLAGQVRLPFQRIPVQARRVDPLLGIGPRAAR
jgi:hypothetical protein